MAKMFLIIAFVALSATAYTQDIIYPRQGAAIAGYVTEVNKRDVKFYKLNDPDSVINSMPKALIDSVVYENGARYILYKQRNIPRALEPRGPKAISEQDVIDNPLKISAGAYYLDDPERASSDDDMSHRMILGTSISIEKIFARNKLGVKLMPFIGMNRMAYGTAIGLTAYPKPYYNVTFHTGPRILLYRTQASYMYYNSADQFTVREIFPANHITFIFDAGFDVRINKNWGVDTDFGIGRLLHQSKKSQTNNNDPYFIRKGYVLDDLMVNGRLGLNYKF